MTTHLDDPGPSTGVLNVRNNPDWMSNLAKLQDANLGDIIWPGTHDSGAHCEDFDYSRVVSEDRLRVWGTYILNRIGHMPRKFVGQWTRTQSLSVFDQLEHGVRFLDLRVSKCLEDGTYYIVHSFCGPKLEKVLKEVISFMTQYTKECVLIEVVPCSFVNHIELYRLFEQLLGDLMLQREQDTSPFSLKLSYLKERGRIVTFYKLLEFRSYMEHLPAFWNSDYLCAPFLMSMEPEAKESFQLDHFKHFNNCEATQSRDAKSVRMFHFMYALTPRLKEIVWSIFTRQDDDPSSLEACAQKINPRLRGFIEKIKNHSSMRGGIIVTIDYVEQSDLVQLAIEMNRERSREAMMTTSDE